MNTMLLVTTILSTAVAAAALFAVFAAFRQERRRSDARVAALQQMAALDPPIDEPSILDDVVLDPEPNTPVAVDEELVAPASPGMFSATAERTPLWRRVAAAAAVAGIVALAGYVLLPSDRAEPAAAQGQTAEQAPLELLSLRHAAETERLVITGLVQNPRSGAARSTVVATAFLFAADGTFLASGRAPLDFPTLAPGDESPFVLAVPVTGTVARYRVGFRGDDGRVIAHLDRRSGGTLARTGE